METDSPTAERTAVHRGDSRDLARARSRSAQHVAAAIGRELRNPVLGIVSAAQLLRYRMSDDPLIERNVGRLFKDAERLSVLVTGLLEYGRPAPLDLAPLDPDDVWDEVVETLRGPLEAKALLVKHMPASPRASRRADREQLAQALGHILANAIEAAADGTDLVIDSRALADGTWESSVRDTGEVPAADTLDRAFEPLFTTRAGHAGLGLAVAQRVADEHGGSLSLQGEADGATTTITLAATYD